MDGRFKTARLFFIECFDSDTGRDTDTDGYVTCDGPGFFPWLETRNTI